MSKRALRGRRDPKAVWCGSCLHHSTKHEHMGYRRLHGFIQTTIRGRCEVDGCACLRCVFVTRLHRDSLLKRRVAEVQS